MCEWMNEYERLLEDDKVGYDTVKEYIEQFMPKKLYRYRSFDKYYKSNIMEGLVYLSFPDAYNDPFDSAVLFDYRECVKHYLGKEAAKSYYQVIKNKKIKSELDKHYNMTLENFKRYLKVACFSKNMDNMLMWSHYAENHSGFCIEYDTEKSEIFKMLALPVIYKNTRYDATKCLLTQSPNIACNPVLYKSDVWSYEREWRLFGTIDFFKNKSDFLDLKESISAIYLGACTKKEDEEKICEICDWATRNGVKVKNMRLDDKTYKLLDK